MYIGGHPSLQKQLKEQYSNWYFIAVDDLQHGEQHVEQADLVIFNSHYRCPKIVLYGNYYTIG